MNKNRFTLMMISAMYENGGNTTHRLLDGHPELMVYPFESQPGTRYVNDYLSSTFPLKYRWPVFPLDASPNEIYEMIIDEECKVRAKTPYVSKFRGALFDFSDNNRKKNFNVYLKNKPLSRALILEAFFSSTFSSWNNFHRTGKEHVYVGYSPIIGVDGNKIIEDYDGRGYILHVVRNPFSAYSDTKKRPVPLSIDYYMYCWVTLQYLSLIYKDRYPKHFFILRYEDIIKDPKTTLGKVLIKLGVKSNDSLKYPSWNGEKLSQVYPWGTVRTPTEAVNIKTAKELSKKEIEEIYQRTKTYIDLFGYKDLHKAL